MPKFVKISDVTVGTILVVANDHFGCLHQGDEREVLGDPGDPDSHYIVCSHGSHMLDGQIGWNDADCDQYVGLYLKN